MKLFARAVIITVLFLVATRVVFGRCPKFLAGQQVGTIKSDLIDEASGLAASRKNPYVLWTHNDKGGSARLFAVNIDGTHLGIYNLSSASNRDWEDIAIGPGPVDGVDYLYIGNIGDNDSQYASITVYRVPEPQVDYDQSPVNVTLTGVETITLQYPDGARDAETLMVDPPTKDIYIISKRDEHPRLYRAPYPQSTTQITMMEYKCELPWRARIYGDWVTAGDISPDGSMVIVRSYFSAWLWLRPADANLWKAFSSPPCDVPLFLEPQGEAICFDGKGDGYFTISEKKHQPIYYFARDKGTKPNQ